MKREISCESGHQRKVCEVEEVYENVSEMATDCAEGALNEGLKGVPADVATGLGGLFTAAAGINGCRQNIKTETYEIEYDRDLPSG